MILASTNSYQRLQSHTGPLDRYPEIFPCDDATYIRATNIRDALKIVKDAEVKSGDWEIEAISAVQINKVRSECLLSVPLALLTDPRLPVSVFLPTKMRASTTCL